MNAPSPIVDLAQQPGAFRAAALPVTLEVHFAEANGTLQTLEGPVTYATGDAMVTGIHGERWPIPRSRFDASYHAAPNTQDQRDGRYMKNPREVWAWMADQDMEIPLRQGTGVLHAQAGAIVVQYGPGDCAVVQPDIFSKTYRRIPDKTALSKAINQESASMARADPQATNNPPRPRRS